MNSVLHVGEKYGRLLVLNVAPSVGGRTAVFVKCDCGITKPIMLKALISGNTKSCGCLRLEKNKTNRITHGLNRTKEHIAWKNMISRCYNPNVNNYMNYGGRGIRVCGRWLSSFELFYKDMGPAPSENHSIDRKRNNGNYTPKNCSWATKTEQNSNQRTNVLIRVGSVTKCLKEWCRERGVCYGTVHSRISSGRYSPIEAITIPIRKGNYKRNIA